MLFWTLRTLHLYTSVLGRLKSSSPFATSPLKICFSLSLPLCEWLGYPPTSVQLVTPIRSSAVAGVVSAEPPRVASVGVTSQSFHAIAGVALAEFPIAPRDFGVSSQGRVFQLSPPPPSPSSLSLSPSPCETSEPSQTASRRRTYCSRPTPASFRVPRIRKLGSSQQV